MVTSTAALQIIDEESNPKKVEDLSQPPANWPSPIDQAALHGIAGEFVRLVEPECEGDPVAVLLNFLVGFGNIVGGNRLGSELRPYREISGIKHHTNLFVNFIGDTSEGRKDTARGPVRSFLRLVDEEWSDECVKSRLATGEGLVHAIRDPVEVPNKDKDGNIIEGRSTTDYGVLDKRLMIYQSELGDLLTTGNRSGNNLFNTLMIAWDGGKLDVPVKVQPIKSSLSHVSYCGNATFDVIKDAVLMKHLEKGYANRFLYFCVARSKVIPIPKSIDYCSNDLINRMKGVIEFAENVGELQWSDEAAKLWDEGNMYRELTAPNGGDLVGLITSRGAPQVLRLAMIYALLDKSKDIKSVHLRAAHAVWKYSVASVKFLFGGEVADKDANKLLSILKSNPDGMTKTDIHHSFGRNMNGERLGNALRLLSDKGLAQLDRERSKGKTQWWVAA